MSVIEKLKQMQRLDGLIRRKATGSPKELASRFDMSERSEYNLVEQMKSMGAPVLYNKNQESFEYEWEVEFKFGFITLDDHERSYIVSARESLRS